MPKILYPTLLLVALMLMAPSAVKGQERVKLSVEVKSHSSEDWSKTKLQQRLQEAALADVKRCAVSSYGDDWDPGAALGTSLVEIELEVKDGWVMNASGRPGSKIKKGKALARCIRKKATAWDFYHPTERRNPGEFELEAEVMPIVVVMMMIEGAESRTFGGSSPADKRWKKSLEENAALRFVHAAAMDDTEALTECYAGKLGEQHRPAFLLDLKVAKDGTVKRADAKRDNVGDKDITRCVLKRVKSWELSELAGDSLELLLQLEP